MRARYVVAPYGLSIVFTDCVKTFNAFASTAALAKGEAVGAFAVARPGKRANYVLGVFDRSWLTVVHEVTHAACTLLGDVGIDPLSNDSEPLAYLVDHLTGVGCRALGIR